MMRAKRYKYCSEEDMADALKWQNYSGSTLKDIEEPPTKPAKTHNLEQYLETDMAK